MQDLENILVKFEKIVSPIVCNELAKKAKLIQRTTSRLKGHEFAQALMIPHAFLEAEKLNSLAVRIQKINKTCNLTAPALSQRINSKGAEVFMKACFGKILKEIIKKDFVCLPGKDNIPFHAVIFPAMTMGQNQPYKLVDELPLGHNVVIVANLKPAVLMGNESHGMVLAGSIQETLEVVSVENLPPGSVVS